MLIDAYSGRDRQHAVQIMQQCADSGLDLAACIDAVKTHKSAPPQLLPSSCPECGERIGWRPVINREQLIIMGCRKCRYSLVIG